MFSLDELDRFSLVVFTTDAQLVFPLCFMTEANRKLHVASLERQQPDNATNIWAGIYQSCEALRNPPVKTDAEHLRTKTVMLLTDGVPNKNPKRGILPELRDY
jgi:Mg-chelatase subunit ChlD